VAELQTSVVDLLKGKNFASVATVMADGSPQVSPVWVDTDGTHVIFNTAAGRTKTRNLERDPRVAISVYDEGNPYRRALIRGRVTEVTTDGADAHIDAMSAKYTGNPNYQGRKATEQRVIVKIVPENVTVQGL
jgi:PPOX class probable F420-dependent enzyme